ncbi:competence protein [Paractinoplanes abujensis]|uniref:Nicotinamide-nucleotide amidase n=1 Tax=Paractinoplanes abujensis TaxID=882441 RepID=A0A7W7CZ70_9ACTN|nr:CinA family protein [Actinoplanes abujensis]MBB4697380.1 nicotinamide-nucleotide amidase [Actinoplanes abujensis]GID18145.1 competence protein [Actinoplanes abujensis]
MGTEIAAQVAVRRLKERRETLATAESLTGGSVAATVVEIEGVSTVYLGGVVVYATEMKHRLAGVPEQLLAERGAVDPDVAKALAEGVRERCGATWGVATTGVAGPEKQDGKPVGLVYVAVAGPAGAQVRELNLDGDRAAIRTESVTRALLLLADCLKDAPAAV